MKELINEVSVLVQKEYDRASDQFGPTNNSDHESYAIILEELEEATVESLVCKDDLQEFWALTKNKDSQDRDKLQSLDTLRVGALLAACEFIQVAAMAHKAKRTIMERGKTKC